MALTATLVETTPQRLLYLITQSGQSVPGSDLVIPNLGPPNPSADLGTDSLDGTPIGEVMDYARTHVLALTQDQARALLLGDKALGAAALLGGGSGPDNNPGVTGDFNAPRCHTHLTARGLSFAPGWGVDAQVVAAGLINNPVLHIYGPPDQDAAAYLEIVYAYSAAT